MEHENGIELWNSIIRREVCDENAMPEQPYDGPYEGKTAEGDV